MATFRQLARWRLSGCEKAEKITILQGIKAFTIDAAYLYGLDSHSWLGRLCDDKAICGNKRESSRRHCDSILRIRNVSAAARRLRPKGSPWRVQHAPDRDIPAPNHLERLDNAKQQWIRNSVTPADSRYSLIPPEVRAKIEGIEADVRAKGWPVEMLYSERTSRSTSIGSEAFGTSA
jgi:hypothetical protein